MMRIVRLTITGKAEQRGSKTVVGKRGGGFITTKAGMPIIKDSNPRSKAWMETVQVQSRFQFNGPLLTGPLRLSICFRLPRPKKHYRTGRFAQQLREDAPTLHAGVPDLAKLVRCFEDSLTGIVWDDDRQVCEYGRVRKIWSDGENVFTTAVIQELETTP